MSDETENETIERGSVDDEDGMFLCIFLQLHNLKECQEKDDRPLTLSALCFMLGRRKR